MVPTLLAASVPAAEDLTGYIPVVVTLLVAGVLAMVIVGLVTAIGRRKISAVKALPFEAGSIPIGNARQRIHVQFYVVALLFIVFDLETVFLFIWAPIFRDLGYYGLSVMAFFLVLLVVGLVYEWKKGALEWAHPGED